MIKDTPLLSLKCKSEFADTIALYIQSKREKGYKANLYVEYLNAFDSFCYKNSITLKNINMNMINKWEQQLNYENPTTHQNRIYAARAFFRFLNDEGYCKLPQNYHIAVKRNKDFIPYIFNKDELKRLFYAINNTRYISSSPIRHLVLPVFFNLLYTTGLRVTEAAKIKKEDVDILKGIIILHNTKNNEDRMISLSSTMKSMIKQYCQCKEIIEFKSEYLFPSPDHGYYDSSTLYDYFRQYLFKAKIHHLGRNKGPRLHDLRHTFAVHVIGKWINEEKDIYVCLPILSKYLGHKNIYYTERYIHLVPEAFQELVNACESKFANIYGEASHE